MDRDPDLAAGQDWRLVPAALVVWLATMLGVLAGWWWVAIVSAVAVVCGAGVTRAARGRPPVVRWWRLGVGWSLIICGLLVTVVNVSRLRNAADDPLRPHANSGVSGVFRVTITERPRPVFSAGFGGQRGGVRAVLLPARVRDAVIGGAAVATTGRVVLIAPVDRWSTLLPGQDVTTAARLAPARTGELTVAVLRVRGPPEEVSDAAVWQRVAQELRSGLRDAAAVLDPEPAGLLPGLVVGDTDGLSRQVEEEFRTAGLAHLLAVSGANLAIVCVAVLLLLRALRVGPRGAAAGAMLALVGFIVLAGPEPSVLRAGVMGAVGLLALAVGRERAALPALGTAVVLLVLWDPVMAVSIGFALSVLATAGLVLLAPRWADRLTARGVPRGLAEALAVPAAAHLVTAPVVAGMAGQVSLVAVLANLLVAPVVAPATVLGVSAALVAPVLPWLAESLVRIAGPEADWLILVGRQASRVPGAAIDWPAGWWGGLLLVVCVALLVAALRRRRLRVLVGAAFAGLLVVVVPVRVIAPGWPPPGWAMVACDVGQGDALVLATAEAGRAVVVDTGPEPGPLAACLDRLDVSRVPLVVLTHLHADHVGGLDAVLDDRAVGAVGVGPARVPDWAWKEVRTKAAAAGVPIVQLDAGWRLEWPGLALEVLAPAGKEVMPTDEADGTEINNASVVMRATTAAGRILLSGDVELAAQAHLLSSRADLSAEVVKVPHHGSRYTTPELFEAIRPRIAVVSVGADNRYGHPSPTTLRALVRNGTLVIRTDTGGDAAIVPGDSGPRAVTRGAARGPPDADRSRTVRRPRAAAQPTRSSARALSGPDSPERLSRGRVWRQPVWRRADVSVGPSGAEPLACWPVFDRLRKAVVGADIPTEPVVIRLPDQRFGMFTVTGEWDPRVVRISGPWRATLTLSSVLALPDALKRRLIWNVPPPRITPMRRDAVRLDVDGQQAPLDCGRRAMRRATFDVRATVAGREYLLRHERRWRARLERGGRTVARLSTSDRGRTMTAVYQPAADAADASVGVALGMVLGVGAPGFMRNLLANLP